MECDFETENITSELMQLIYNYLVLEWCWEQ